MPYTIIDAIKDEIKFLIELEKCADERGASIVQCIYEEQRHGLNRLLNRVTKGYDYSVKPTGKIDKNNKPEFQIYYEKTNRKTLEEEYPALKTLAEQYELVHNLVDSEPTNKNG